MDAPKIPLRDIPALHHVLHNIQSNGGTVHRSAILPADHPGPVSQLEYPKMPPEQTLDLIARMKTLHSSLKTILDCIHQDILSIQPHANQAALNVGVHKLPDHILSYIFKDAYTSLARFNKNRFSMRVAEVSRRFRKVALETPQIWTYLRNTHTRSILELCIKRAGGSGLTIDIDESHVDEFRIQSTPALRHFLAMVTPLSKRWSTLRCRLAYPESGTMASVIVNELSRFGHLDLPALAALDYMDASQRPDDGNTALFFFQHAMMPAVTHYVGEHVVPHPDLAKQLTSLDLHISFWDRSTKAHRLKDLILFLARASELTDLALDFHSFNLSSLPAHASIPAHISLPRLQALHIKLNSTSAAFLSRFLAILTFPALVSLKLQWGTQLTIEEDVSDLLQDLFVDDGEGEGEKWENLQELKILIQNSAIQLDHVPSAIFYLPNLRHLSMRPVRISWAKHRERAPIAPVPQNGSSSSTTNTNTTTTSPGLPISPLQTLTLLDCQGYNRSQITEVLSLLRKGAHWGSFERLRVESAHPLTEPFLVEVGAMVEGRLEWCL